MTTNQQSDASPTPFIQEWLQIEDPDERREFLRTHHSGITDETVQAMKSAVSHRLRQDPRDALNLAECILYAATLSERPMHRAWGWMAKGNVLRFVANYQQAIAAYDEAHDICLSQDQGSEAARSQIGKIFALSSLGRFHEALDTANKARSILEENNEWLAAARVNNVAAIVYGKQGLHNEELELFNRAHARFEQAGPESRLDLAITELNRSVALRNLDRFDEAIEAASNARRLATELGLTMIAARADQSQGVTHFFLGQYNKALSLFDQAKQVFQAANLERDVTVANLFATNCHLALNRYAEALDLASKAEKELARLDMPYEMAWAAYNRAQAHIGLNHVEMAADALALARLGFAQIENQVWVATVDIQWAVANLRIEAFEAALNNARRASEVFAKCALVVEKAQADLVAAEALIALAQDDKAHRICLAALQIARDRDVPWLANQARHLLGHLAEMEGDEETALEYYEDCAAGVERLRRQVAVELRGSFLADKGEIYEDAVSLWLARTEVNHAFDYVERAKSRALVELLAHNLDIRVKVRRESDRDMVAHVERLRQECQWYYNRLDPFGEREGAESGPTQVEQDRLREELNSREKQLADMLLQLQVRNAKYTQDADLWQVQVESPQPYLDRDTLLVEYFIARGEVLAFSITQGEIQVHRRLTTVSQLTRLLSLLHLNLHRLSPALIARGDSLDSEWANLQGLLGRLYTMLVLPLAARMASFERLIVVPHGPLHYLPFHALHNGRDYLVERCEISYLPNSSLLRLQRASKTNGQDSLSALVVGCSLDGVLPNTLLEAQQVNRRLRGTSLLEGEATRTNLEAHVGTARVIHMATHGEFRPDAPLFSTLYLADGPLTATDVFNLEINASLVTLSACQSGASAVGGGDELVGFSRAFLYAGAASLLMSLWRVEDQATAHFMDRFYRALLESQRKPAALRQAQLALLRGEEGHHYRHPFYWAPFFLVGDCGQMM
jgi:CHAT domain-containing protein/tetratricopeptide (TPR) repeat protein